jgi:hypothetical protein
MKRCLNRRCAAFVLPLLMGTAAQAATVVWPAVRFGPYESYDSTHAIASNISPVGDVAVWLEVVCGPGWDATLYARGMTVGIRHWWFATQYGAAVDASALVNANFLVNADPMEFGSIEMPYNQVFYLGFQLDAPPNPAFPDVPVFIYGWAALLWNGTDLTLVDSAAEMTGAGIYAGTYNAIPEPSAAGLLLAGLAALAIRRRHTRRLGG